MGQRVADLERRVADALAVAAAATDLPHLGVRKLARSYLHGQLERLPELIAPPMLIADADAPAAALLDAAGEAVRVLQSLTDVAERDVVLPPDHHLVRRADGCEVEAWRGFMRRVVFIVGE